MIVNHLSPSHSSLLPALLLVFIQLAEARGFTVAEAIALMGSHALIDNQVTTVISHKYTSKLEYAYGVLTASLPSETEDLHVVVFY